MNQPSPISSPGSDSKIAHWQYRSATPLPEQIVHLAVKIPCSSDYGDVDLYTFMQWHFTVCAWCRMGQLLKPPVFGARDTRHCADYYEIVEEYAEYERVYIRMGNP